MAQTNPQIQTKFTPQNVLNNVYDDINKALAVISFGWNGGQVQANNADSLSLELEYDGSGNPIYIGLAAPGTTTSSDLWQIRHLTFDGNGNVTSILFANGSPLFDQAWDDRASLAYV